MISSVDKKQKLLNTIEENLLSYRKYKRTWLIILGLTILFFGLTAITLGYQFAPHSESITNIMTANWGFANASRILVYVSYGIFVIPYLFLSGSWISGMNNVTKSKYFHIFIWITYSICYLLVLMSIIFCFRSIMA